MSDVKVSKPAGAVLGIFLSVDHCPSVQYNLLDKMPLRSQIRKDSYQHWLYLERPAELFDSPGVQELCEMLETTDCSMNPNKYPGIVCETQNVMSNSEYFWQDTVNTLNEFAMMDHHDFYFMPGAQGAVATNIRVPADFVVLSFAKLVKKHTVFYNGQKVLTVSMSRRSWAESTLPTVLLRFQEGVLSSVEVCDIWSTAADIGLEIEAPAEITYNTSKSSVR